MNHLAQNLEIHLHKVDGSIEKFLQSDVSRIDRILDQFQPDLFFVREKILIANGNSLISIPTRQIVRLDMIFEPDSDGIMPDEIVQAVELDETEYRALIQKPELGHRWNQARAREVSEAVFLELELTGQPPLFLTLQLTAEQLADRPEAILHPLYPLATPGLCFRMQTGGIAILNLLHLTRFHLFPAPQQTPATAWRAQRVEASPPDYPAGILVGTTDNRAFPPPGRRPSVASRSQRESTRTTPNDHESKHASTMERKSQ